jgi:hypothetical protein
MRAILIHLDLPADDGDEASLLPKLDDDTEPYGKSRD